MKLFKPAKETMNPNLSLLSLLCLLSFASIFSSCKKDKDGPETDPITLDCDYFESAQTLTDDPDRPIDYIVTCVMNVDADVKVMPGVVIEFAEEAGIYVRETGSFNAVGTSNAPVTLTGTSKSTGWWKGVLFDSDKSSNQLQYVNLSYAGSSTFNTNNDIASVIVWADSRVEIGNCNILNSGNFGISAIYTNSNWSISNSRISASNNAPVTFLAPYLSSFDGSNDFAGNSKDYLLLDLATQSINSNLTWKKANVPYRITSTYSQFHELLIENGTLTMEAGVEVMMEAATGIWVDENANLIANGSASEPISFSGVDLAPGSWTSIYFDANVASSSLSHVNISHAGAELDFDNAGILMRVNPPLTLDNVVFSDILACSIFNKDVIDNPNLTATNLIHNNTNGTICHQ